MTKEPAAGALKGFLAAGSSELLYGFGRLSLSAPMQALSENGMARQGEGGKEVWFYGLRCPAGRQTHERYNSRLQCRNAIAPLTCKAGPLFATTHRAVLGTHGVTTSLSKRQRVRMPQQASS